jgi:hypothetical protein
MKLQETTTRRALLKTALSLGLAVGMSRGAQAYAAPLVDNPFLANAPWTGFVSSPSGVPQAVELTSGSIQVGNSAPISISLSFDANSGSVTINGNGIFITGQVFPFYNTFVLLPGASETNCQINGTAGTLIMVRQEAQGPVIPELADINRASLEIFPPDFIGMLVSNLTSSGRLRITHALSTRELPRYSKVTGGLTLNGQSFAYALTFSPVAALDGSYGFTLVGNTGRTGNALLVISGRFTPRRRTTLARLVGDFQRIAPRGGSLVEAGRFTITQVL